MRDRADSFMFKSSSKSIEEEAYSTNYNKKLFPEWLENQEEFKKLRETKGNYGVNNIFKI